MFHVYTRKLYSNWWVKFGNDWWIASAYQAANSLFLPRYNSLTISHATMSFTLADIITIRKNRLEDTCL